MDDLLHFVRHEVAMDGDDGTPIDRLDSFIHTYYARAAEDNKNGSSASIPTQNIDEAFKDFVWRQLASLPELTVAFLRKIVPNPVASTSALATAEHTVATPDKGSLPPPPLPEGAQDAGNAPTPGASEAPVEAGNNENGSTLLDEDGNPIDQGEYNLKNKAKIKASRKDNQKRDRDARLSGGNDDLYEFIEIGDEEIQSLNRKELLEKYGDTLRIAADPETCYVALTGSHERFGKLTALAYQVLQAIARGRENGKTVIELGKEFEHDQKSLFHFVKSLVGLNLIVKMKVVDARSQTSRCLHRHYLETSQHWATWMTKDSNQDTTKAEDDDDDLGKTAALTMMTVAHLNSNEPFVRSRIINALRNAPENLIPHTDLVFAIGFHARPGRLDRRQFNRIITRMEKKGLVEKVGVARQGTRSLLSCLKLRTNGEQEGEDAMPRSHSEEDEVEQRPNLLLTLPIERQVIDLLVSAAAQGLTLRELQAGLGDVGIRSLETLLIRIEKYFEPPHLCDYRIQSVYETHGREKRLRYFTTAGYHERCRLDGLGDIPNMADFTHPDLAGDFSVLDKSEFYATPEEFAELAEKMQTNSRPGVRYPKNGPKAKAKTSRDPTEPVKKGRPKGSTKKAKEAKNKAAHGEASATAAVEGDNADTEAKTKKKRQKEEKVEGEEGQPPRKKAKARKSQPPEDSRQELPNKIGEEPVAVPSGTRGPLTEMDGSTAPSAAKTKKKHQKKEKVEGEEGQPPKKKAKARKSQQPEDSRQELPNKIGEEPVAAPSGIRGPLTEMDGTTAPSAPVQPKKRGRPRKIRVDTEAPSAVPSAPLPAEATASPGPSTPAASAAKASKQTEGQDIPASRSKEKGRPPKVYAEDDPAALRKKRKAEIDLETGLPIRGRPRKYPPGTNSTQRKKLLEERRIAGLEPPLEPPLKKQKGDSEKGENDSVPPSADTPVPEDGSVIDLSMQSGLSSPVPGLAADGLITPEAAAQQPPVPQIIDTADSASTGEMHKQNPDRVAAVQTENADTTAEMAASSRIDVAIDASSEDAAVGSLPPPTVIDNASEAPVSATHTAPQPPVAKRPTRSRKSTAQDVTTPGKSDISSAATSQVASTDALVPEQMEAVHNAGNTSLRRSKRQKTGDVSAVAPVEARRGRSSKIPPEDIVVKEESAMVPELYAQAGQSESSIPSTTLEAFPESIEQPNVPAENTQHDSESTRNTPPVRARSTSEAPARTPQAENIALPAQGASQEAIPSGPTTEITGKARESISKVASPAALITSAPATFESESTSTAADTAAPQQQKGSLASTPDNTLAPANGNEDHLDASQMSIDLPTMPEPLPGSAIHELSEEQIKPVDIAPNVVAKPVLDTADQDKGVSERKNHSMKVHENEYIATLQDIGGIAEDGMPLTKFWQDFMQRKNPDKPPPKPLDRRTMKGIATSLEKRGIVKRSILQFQNFDGKMVQRHIMYLSTISLDSSQMREFAVSMQEKMDGILAGHKNWLPGRKTLDKTDEMVSVAPRRGPRALGEVPTDPRPFFMKNWRVVAQHFGWQYGFLARARTLHEHLIRSITDENDSTFIVSSDPRVRIFASPFVLLDTPLSVFMRIAAVSEYSAELEEFLRQDGLSNVCIKDLPPVLSGLFDTKRAKGYSRFSQLFEILMLLKLLVPVEQVEYETPIVAYSGTEREPRYFAAMQERSGATYWLLPGQAPVYDLQEKKASEQKLLGQLPVSTPGQAAYFWDTLHKLTFGCFDPVNLPRPTVKYPPTLNAPFRFIYAARTSSRWRAEYLLLAQQKTYLRRSLEEAVSKDALLSNEEKIQELAYNVCAPAAVVRAYYAKPQLGARPEWAKKRKRRAIARPRPKTDDSDTSASEAEGPVAPRPRSECTEQATEERRNAEKAAREAAKARKQQQIIAMKAKGASQAKQAVWDGIVNGFKMQHGEEALKAVQLDFLHTWFMSSEGPTATTIQQHLEQSVEGVRTAPTAISSRSVLAPKTGSVMYRGKENRMKTKLLRREPASTVETPSVEDILLRNLPELPEVEFSGSKKTPKSGWTPEEDEQLTDLYAILQSRANDRATRLSMEPATAFYPGMKAKALVDRLRFLAMKPGEVPYLDALQDAWSRLWHDGRIRDPLLHEAARSVTKEGLLLLRRVLNGVLNKQSLRFQAIMPAEAAAASQIQLPVDPSDLKKSYLVDFKAKPEDPESPQTWDYLWSMITTVQKSAKFIYQPFRTQYDTRLSAAPATSQERVDLFNSRYKPLSKVPANYVKDAEAFEKRLADESVVEWNPVCEDGDLLALAHLFSEDLLNFSVDTTITRAGRPYTDYRTRKIDDDNFENALTVQPNQAFLDRTAPLFTPDLVETPHNALIQQTKVPEDRLVDQTWRYITCESDQYQST